jgi:RNA polymerase sigma-70 factor (ECF subfamily)
MELLAEPEAWWLDAAAGIAARRTCLACGEIVLLADQDRSLWNREQMRKSRAGGKSAGFATLRPVFAAGGYCSGTRVAQSPEATDWREIVGLYDILLRADPSPIVELNRAVAVAMRDGPADDRALSMRSSLADLQDYRLAHAARADPPPAGRDRTGVGLLRAGPGVTQQVPERRFLERRLHELQS